MQSLKALSLARRSRFALRFLPQRGLSAAPSAAQDDDLQSQVGSLLFPIFSWLNSNFFFSFPFVDLFTQVLVEGKASARAAVLNRPSSLNALTTNMVCVFWVQVRCSMICLADPNGWFQGIRLKKFYESWEDNPDIGFVMMKVVSHLGFSLFSLGLFWRNKKCLCLIM